MTTVKLYANLREIAGGKRIDVPFEHGGTVRDLLAALQQAHPELAGQIVGPDGELTGLAHVFVDGRNVIWLENQDTVIKPGASIDLIPPVAGG